MVHRVDKFSERFVYAGPDIPGFRLDLVAAGVDIGFFKSLAEIRFRIPAAFLYFRALL